MEFILAIAGLAALFWAGAVFVRGGPIGGALLVLLAGSCFGQPFFNVPIGPVPLTIDRLLLAALLVQYFVYRNWGWVETKPLERADFLLAGFLILVVASTVTNDYRFRNGQPLSQLVFFYVMPAVLYWVVREADLSERGARWTLWSLGLFGAYLCITAIAESRGAWEIVLPSYVASHEHGPMPGRARGPLLDPVAGGIVQSLGLCAAAICWLRLHRVGQLLLVAALPLFGWGIYCTMSPSVWIGAVCGLAMIAVLSVPRRWRVAAVSAAAVVAVAAIFVTRWPASGVPATQGGPARQVADSPARRPMVSSVSWQMFLDKPLLGWGFGQYDQASLPYLAKPPVARPATAAKPIVEHNVALALLTETGLIGSSLFALLLLSWTRTAWRLWRSDAADLWVRQMGLLFLAFLAIYLANAAVHDVSTMPMINMFLFFLGGAMVGLAPWLVDGATTARLKLWTPRPEPVVGIH